MNMASKRDSKDKEVQKTLEGLGHDLVKQIEKGENPLIEMPVRSLNNIYFDQKTKTIKLGDKTSQRQFLNVAHARKFMQTTLIAKEIRNIIGEKATISIRDLYYALKHTIPGTQENTFEDQAESDPVIEDLEASLNLLREEFHLAASSKGVIAGDMVIQDGDDVIDLTKMGSGGWGVPSNVEPDR